MCVYVCVLCCVVASCGWGSKLSALRIARNTNKVVIIFAGLSTRSTSKVTSRAQPLQSLLLLLLSVEMVWDKGFSMWNQQIKHQ